MPARTRRCLWTAAAALAAVIGGACGGESTATSEASASSSGGTTSTSSSSSSGSGGSGGGDAGAADRGPAGTTMANAGRTTSSANYKMVLTFGQSSPAQGITTSSGYRLRGGVTGATGTAK